MVTQTIEFPWSGIAPTAKLRIFGSSTDAIAQTASIVTVGSSGIASAVFTDAAAADYWLLLYESAGSLLDVFQVRLKFTTQTYQAKYNIPDPVDPVEPSRLQRYQNKVASSIVSSAWTKTLTSTVDGFPDPFGGMWAVRLSNSDTTAATHRVTTSSNSAAVPIGSTNQYIVAWIRGTANQFWCGFSTTNSVNYNVSTRTVLYANGASLVSDQSVGDWRKITIFVPLTNNATIQLIVDCPNTNGSTSFTPPNTTNYYDIVLQITDDPDIYLFAPTSGTAFAATTMPAAPESYVAIAADVTSIVDMLPTTDYLAGSAASDGAVVLDSATLVRFVTEDTGETVAAAGSVAKLAQGSAGGSTSVTVLPATGIVANRSPGVTLLPVVGETISQSITVYQTDGTTPVDLSGKTLKIIFESLNGTDVAVVLNADISISGTDDNVVTFAYPTAVTASERSLRFALRDAAAPLTMYLQGLCSVVSAPQVDP